jgi:hypothetical protein
MAGAVLSLFFLTELAIIGSAFAFVFVANLEQGKFRATLLTAWVHFVHNAVVILAVTSES